MLAASIGEVGSEPAEAQQNAVSPVGGNIGPSWLGREEGAGDGSRTAFFGPPDDCDGRCSRRRVRAALLALLWPQTPRTVCGACSIASARCRPGHRRGPVFSSLRRAPNL